jgi:hypothetical protein
MEEHVFSGAIRRIENAARSLTGKRVPQDERYIRLIYSKGEPCALEIDNFHAGKRVSSLRQTTDNPDSPILSSLKLTMYTEGYEYVLESRPRGDESINQLIEIRSVWGADYFDPASRKNFFVKFVKCTKGYEMNMIQSYHNAWYKLLHTQPDVVVEEFQKFSVVGEDILKKFIDARASTNAKITYSKEPETKRLTAEQYKKLSDRYTVFEEFAVYYFAQSYVTVGNVGEPHKRYCFPEAKKILKAPEVRGRPNADVRDGTCEPLSKRLMAIDNS